MSVLGVDGWPRGWVAAKLDGRRVSWSVHATAGELVAAHADAEVVGIDMPIGTTDGPRDPDVAARTWLGRRGGSPSSIFPTPTTTTVAAHVATGGDHAEAMRRLRGTEAGTSIQAWRLIPKIIEVADVADARFVEVHPECSFAELAPAAVAHSKKSAKGMALRWAALSSALDLPDLTEAPDRVPVDDLLDATVAAWSAARHAAGRSFSFPANATAPPRIVV